MSELRTSSTGNSWLTQHSSESVNLRQERFLSSELSDISCQGCIHHWGALSAGVKKAYGSYDDLAKDPDVDLVYISNLHTQHKDTVLTMTAAKKHILCEKPLSVNKKETQVMIDAAEKADVFFMAGLWSRFFPAQKK